MSYHVKWEKDNSVRQAYELNAMLYFPLFTERFLFSYSFFHCHFYVFIHIVGQLKQLLLVDMLLNYMHHCFMQDNKLL